MGKIHILAIRIPYIEIQHAENVRKGKVHRNLILMGEREHYTIYPQLHCIFLG